MLHHGGMRISSKCRVYQHVNHIVYFSTHRIVGICMCLGVFVCIFEMPEYITLLLFNEWRYIQKKYLTKKKLYGRKGGGGGGGGGVIIPARGDVLILLLE